MRPSDHTILRTSPQWTAAPAATNRQRTAILRYVEAQKARRVVQQACRDAKTTVEDCVPQRRPVRILSQGLYCVVRRHYDTGGMRFVAPHWETTVTIKHVRTKEQPKGSKASSATQKDNP